MVEMADGGFSMPDDVLEIVQSFMNHRDAARSAVLNKRLYRAWCGLKSVEMIQEAFGDGVSFWTGAKKTITRYMESGAGLEKISMSIIADEEHYGDAVKVLEGAALVGVRDMHINIIRAECAFRIPDGIFAADRVVNLTVVGGVLDLDFELQCTCNSVRNMVIMPDRHLFGEGDFINNYVMRCPSLETLKCSGFVLRFDCAKMVGRTHGLSTLTVDGLTFQDHLHFYRLIHCMTALKSLVLTKLYNCHSLPIYSASIELLSITERDRRMTAILNIPKMRMFQFDGVSRTSFTFKSIHTDWPAHLNVCCNRDDRSWFASLYRLISSLPSKHITVTVRVMIGNPTYAFDSDDSRRPIAIDKLEVHTVHPNPTLIACLRRVCEPTIYVYNHV